MFFFFAQKQIKENGIAALKKQPNTTQPSEPNSQPLRSKITKKGNRKFKTPFLSTKEEEESQSPPEPKTSKKNQNSKTKEKERNPLLDDERLIGCEEHMVELILSEIVDKSQPVSWNDIAGLHSAKKTINELTILPMKHPHIFTGIRAPPKGLLLFGPPGTGKTLIGKAIASQINATFFSISASSLTSKWVGEGEKMVRTMFAIARCHEPAVIFVINRSVLGTHQPNFSFSLFLFASLPFNRLTKSIQFCQKDQMGRAIRAEKLKQSF